MSTYVAEFSDNAIVDLTPLLTWQPPQRITLANNGAS
jgi:hypothetical protein